jgi:hypothetical protein
MNNDQKFAFTQLIKEIDIFEEKFVENPADKSLLEFFGSFNRIVNEGVYTKEQLQGIRDRILKLQEKFSETREALSKKTNDTLDRHKNFSQYIKTSHINKQ